ncbi:RimJ/RimL family protein N-acetyltransferase [Nesterenkonia lacusekhoensis]|uniref:RimJ/RimL family protein N-acetyltransferase n=1 Tax=Nesterenkonia lacusekhoensis TaxID=150832 RepID=A0ABS4T281_9MICC|nr:RimJ/RimL family protein N-acetyltransferase [Nesterenkonia lacusekhoensis]
MPLWSRSADSVAARVHRATSGAVRVLESTDTPALLRLLERDPAHHVSVLASVRSRGTAAPGRGRIAAMLLGIDDPEHPGELASACWVGSNITPVHAGPAEGELFGLALRALRRRVSSVYGDAEAVLELHDAAGWVNVREVRADQPLLSIDVPSAIEPMPEVRPSRLEEFDAVEQASAAMFTEELGFSPYTQGVSEYQQRVRSLISGGYSLIAVGQDGEIIFKAEFGAVSREVVQVQGVWVHPEHRGRGLAASGMSAVVDYGLKLAPVVSLYVNGYNTAALRTYQRVGFRREGTFATILF